MWRVLGFVVVVPVLSFLVCVCGGGAEFVLYEKEGRSAGVVLEYNGCLLGKHCTP